jgi:2-C-methyl-D-erythritol 2,4-cyclodiphosphate synthase
MKQTPQPRVGIGFDFHPFEADRELILGGVTIPYPKGLGGHSDADALLHAVADALLGSVGLSDLGSYFPDTDPKYKDSSSMLLLEKACSLVHARGYRVGNVDVVVIAEEPKIRPFADAMRANLARVLNLSTQDIGLKATTMEGKGVIGQKEGLAVQAVVSVYWQGSPDLEANESVSG